MLYQITMFQIDIISSSAETSKGDRNILLAIHIYKLHLRLVIVIGIERC